MMTVILRRIFAQFGGSWRASWDHFGLMFRHLGGLGAKMFKQLFWETQSSGPDGERGVGQMGNRWGQMGNAASGRKFDFPGSTHPILEGFGSL